MSVDVFQAIADPTRRQLLRLLVEREQPVGALASSFQMTLPAVSQHLRVLREAGLVAVRPAGRERYYRVTPEPLQEVAAWAAPFWRDKLAALGDYLERSSE